MPLIMRFDSADLLQCRFAVSPLTETTDALRSIAVDASHRIDVAALRDAIARDRAAGRDPFLVVASAGTVRSFRSAAISAK